MADELKSLVDAVGADNGLRNSISDNKILKGQNAAEKMNTVLLNAIERSGVNNDGLITGADMATISETVYDKPAQYVKFLEGHGNDNGDVVSGFHYVQGDGGTLQFQGRDFIDTVADAIYHYGFKVIDGRFVNEDGAANETAKDVAGWLNYFLNGENVVFGGGAAETLGSGEYSNYFKDANAETFYAGKGADKIWAGDGRDKVYGEQGNDTSGGGNGNDKMWGGGGADKFMGDAGNDKIWGGAGKDALYGGDGADEVYGGAGLNSLYGGNGNDDMFGGDEAERLDGGNGNDDMDGNKGRDLMYGGAGKDAMQGGKGNDDMSGGDGNDKIKGGNGNDELSGGAGRDKLTGGAGRDTFQLWEENQVTDTIIFAPGDSGRKASNMDYVEGFNTDHDLINLKAFDGLKFTKLDFVGGGKGSVYFDGDYLRIDADGDRAADMIIEFRHASEMTGDNFLF